MRTDLRTIISGIRIEGLWRISSRLDLARWEARVIYELCRRGFAERVWSSARPLEWHALLQGAPGKVVGVRLLRRSTPPRSTPPRN
jgi:hypothetical protein